MDVFLNMKINRIFTFPAFTIFIVMSILFSSCIREKNSNPTPVFSKEIAPIFYENCSSCHRPGSGAPFNLITYEDIVKKIHTVQLSINERLMPPWPADTSYSHFVGEKVLSENEIHLINRWIEAGFPIGDTNQIPQPPDFGLNTEKKKPDFIIRMRQPFLIKGDNTDNFIMLKIPYEFPSDTFIRTIEIVPGNKKLVHHINAHLIQYFAGAKKDNQKGVAYVNTELHDKISAYQLLSLPNDDGSYPLLTPSVSNYLPGVEAVFYPPGIGGLKVKKQGAILLDNIHYGPSPIDTSDQTTFNFYFSPTAPERPLREFIIGTSGVSPIIPPLVIPPHTVKKFISSYRVPEDISLLTINPHMHLLGIFFQAYVLLPDGDTLPLIRIKKWDFRWQYFYTFPKILKIPAGSLIQMEGLFDNTENNPLVPFHPPRTISERAGSMRTTDEMFQLICTYLPYKPGDENIRLENKQTEKDD